MEWPRRSTFQRSTMKLSPRPLATGLATGLLSLVLAGSASGTWSIVVLDRTTREVAIAGATCIEDAQLASIIAALRIDRGAGATQALSASALRQVVFHRLEEGLTPDEIVAELQVALPNPNQRQFGVVSFAGPPATFSGSSTGLASTGVAGSVGSIDYAIQGNVLAGVEVVMAAEAALRNTQGDLGQRVMAAMQAARSFGGDGRCSCVGGPPWDMCGSPPPNFTKSAHTAFIIVGRIGDEEGECVDGTPCSFGDYYLFRRAIGDASDLDPVEVLQDRYDTWRSNRIGRTDQVLTRVQASAQRLVADGSSSLEVRIQLVDLDGNDLSSGGQSVFVRRIGAGPDAALVSGQVDHGDGTHSFTLSATGHADLARFRIVVEDAGVPVSLHPPLEVPVDGVQPLHVGFDSVSSSAGADVPFVLNAGAAEAGRSYIVLGSASGTVPGTPFGGQTLPLNSDRILRFTFGSPGPPLFPGSAGQLDAAGRAQATFRLSSAALSAFPGRWDFVGVLFGAGPVPDDFTNGVGFDVLP